MKKDIVVKAIAYITVAVPIVLGLGLFFLPPLSTEPKVEEEARQQANAAFETFRVKCGQDYAVAIDVAPAPAGGFAPALPAAPVAKPSGHTVYVMYADVRLNGRDTTSDIDRRNGIAWRGTFTFSAEAARQVSAGKDGTTGAWSPWQAAGPIYAVTLVLKDGAWSSRVDEMPLVANLGRYAKLRRPACSDLPPG